MCSSSETCPNCRAGGLQHKVPAEWDNSWLKFWLQQQCKRQILNKCKKFSYQDKILNICLRDPSNRKFHFILCLVQRLTPLYLRNWRLRVILFPATAIVDMMVDSNPNSEIHHNSTNFLLEVYLMRIRILYSQTFRFQFLIFKNLCWIILGSLTMFCIVGEERVLQFLTKTQWWALTFLLPHSTGIRTQLLNWD